MNRNDWLVLGLLALLIAPAAAIRWTRHKLDPRDWSTT